jgi:hypothetical protein
MELKKLQEVAFVAGASLDPKRYAAFSKLTGFSFPPIQRLKRRRRSWPYRFNSADYSLAGAAGTAC